MRNDRLNRIACLVALTLLALSNTRCATVHTTQGIDDTAKMRHAILQAIPPGTSLDAAQRFMEKEGFKCSRETNRSIGGLTAVDCLDCDRMDGGLVKRRWQIYIIHHEGSVVDLMVYTGLVGP